MEILTQLFGNITRVKLMRLFLFNPGTPFTSTELVARVKSSKGDTRKALAELLKMGIAKKRPIVREVHIKKKKKVSIKKVNDTGYFLDEKFPYLMALKNLLITVSLHADETLVRKFNTVGRIKLFIASGLFIQEWDTRVDLLIVGDSLNLARLDVLIKIIESEVGREIAYSAFETTDFEYRVGIHDRLIRDILDSPHTTLVDKLGIDQK